MPREFLTHADGSLIVFPETRRKLAFQIAETLTLELGVPAVAARKKDPVSGGRALAIYLNSGASELATETLREAARMCRELLTAS